MKPQPSDPNGIPSALARVLRNAQHVMVLTGAGASAESGVPTFRDARSGIWAQLNPEEVASREGFLRDPARAWAWYALRRRELRAVRPNPAHLALAEMERRVPGFVLVTQNVDGLHQQAGSRRVVELHGNIERVRCFDEDEVIEDWPGSDRAGEIGDGTLVAEAGHSVNWSHIDNIAPPPRCPRCGGYLRPDIVWFGEMLPRRALFSAIEAARQCDLFFSVGTSSQVEPAASLAFEALARGAPVIEINPESTPLTRYATYALAGPAGKLLPDLIERTWGRVSVASGRSTSADVDHRPANGPPTS
jgi:NAD-dependent deacetylase